MSRVGGGGSRELFAPTQSGWPAISGGSGSSTTSVTSGPLQLWQPCWKGFGEGSLGGSLALRAFPIRRCLAKVPGR
jgi:hypothetical protein